MVLSNRHRYPQGTNVEEKEFDAIQSMLKGLQFEMPAVSEYKNELPPPPFLQALPPPPCRKSSSTALSIIPPEEITSNSPPSNSHWAKLETMVD